MFEERVKPQEILSWPNILAAAVLHALFFFTCWLIVRPIPQKPEIKPFTIIPPEEWQQPEPEQPKPEPPKPDPPKPKPEPPKPKIDPPKPKDALIKETPKTNKVERVEQKKPEEKKPEEKKPEEKKKSAKELREERMKKMRESATTVKPKNPPPVKVPPVANPRGKPLSEKEILDALSKGAKFGEENSIPDDELSRQMSLIHDAFHSRWVSPPYSPALREMILSVTFDNSGNVTRFSLTQSSGDAAADATVKRAAAMVRHIPGLTPSFLRANRTVSVRFKVRQQ